MASEAILKVKQAEVKSQELLANAHLEAKEILSKSENEVILTRKAIIKEALEAKEKLIQAAVEKANVDSEPLLKQGIQEKGSILNPEKSKFDVAVKLVRERIVNVNGNS